MVRVRREDHRDEALEGGPAAVLVREADALLLPREEEDGGEHVGVPDLHAGERLVEGGLVLGVALLAVDLLRQRGPVQEDRELLPAGMPMRLQVANGLGDLHERAAERIGMLGRFPAVRHADHRERMRVAFARTLRRAL